MSQYTRRRFVAAGLGAATIGSLAGCSGSQSAEDTDTTESSTAEADTDEPTEKTFAFGSQWGVSSLDPMEGSTQLQRIGIFESVVSIDWNGSIQPQLASEWTTSDDGRTWVFELRDDVQFHDGEPFDAEAMTASLRRAFETSLSVLPIETVNVTGQRTLEIRTSEPFAPMLAHLTRRKAVAMSPNSFSGESFDEPIGTGPFAFDSWDSAAGDVTLVANEEYYGETASIDRISYQNVSDGQTRELKIRNGELDMATQISPTAVSRLQKEDDVKLQTYTTPRLRYFSFNLTEPPADDRRVRQAFMFGIDTESIVSAVLNGFGQAATGLIPPTIDDWHNAELDPYSHDPERAGSLLEQAGWEDAGNGPRQRDGEPLEITLWTYNSRPALATIGEAIQQQLQNVGFEVDVRVTDWGGMDSAKESGEASMTLESTSVYGWPPDPDRLRYFTHTEEGKAVGYENENIDELLADGRRETDRERRKDIYDEVQRIAHNDLPVGVLTYQENVIGLQESVNGHDPHPTEYRYNLEDVDL